MNLRKQFRNEVAHVLIVVKSKIQQVNKLDTCSTKAEPKRHQRKYVQKSCTL